MLSTPKSDRRPPPATPTSEKSALQRHRESALRNPCRGIVAAAFIYGAGACLRTAERLLRVPSGTVLAARREMENRRG